MFKHVGGWTWESARIWQELQTVCKTLNSNPVPVKYYSVTDGSTFQLLFSLTWIWEHRWILLQTFLKASVSTSEQRCVVVCKTSSTQMPGNIVHYTRNTLLQLNYWLTRLLVLWHTDDDVNDEEGKQKKKDGGGEDHQIGQEMWLYNIQYCQGERVRECSL